MKNEKVLEYLVKGSFIEETIEDKLYYICDETHAQCNNNCPVYRVNGSEVPDTAKDFEVNRGCDCFKDGKAMFNFIAEKLQELKY
jgi:hypothetical protein